MQEQGDYREGYSLENKETIKRIQAALFDYGGVIAGEGFRNGLKAIAFREHIDPDTFFKEE